MSGGQSTDGHAVGPERDESLDDPWAVEVVVFDIGEVLVDETRVWSVWAEIVGTSPLTFAAALGAAIVQGGDHEDAFAHVVPNVEWRELEEEHEARLGGLLVQDLYPDATGCLRELAAEGFGVVVAGNQPARRHPQLAALDLPHDHLVTSEELGHEKPDPSFFAKLLVRIGDPDPSRVLYVGDRVDNDVLPAMAAGLRTCWLRRGPWGVLQALPDGIEVDLALEGLGELPELLRPWCRG